MATISVSDYNLIPCVSGIYVLENLFNGKKYIGQSRNIRKRLILHLSRAKNPITHKSALYSAMAKYGVDNFSIKILELCDSSLLNYYESFWIKELNCMSPNGYNLDSGGDYPEVISDEWKLKNSLAQKGRKQSKETIQRRVISLRGRKDTDEQKQRKKLARSNRPKESDKKTSNTLMGHEVSTDTRYKISQKLKGVCTYEHSRAVIRNDGVVFESIKEAAIESRVAHSNIWKVLNGERKTTGVYSFSYLGD